MKTSWIITNGIGWVVALAVSQHACQTTDRYVRAENDRESFAIYTSADKRSTIPNPGEDRNVNSAARKLSDQIAKKPNDVTSALNLARIEFARGDYNASEKAAKQALRHDIKNTEAKKVLAQIAIRRAKTDLASIILNSIGGEQSKDAEVVNLMALVALAQNAPSHALQLFKKALTIDPGNVAVRMNLGVSYLKYRQVQQASVQFERVLKVMPKNPDAQLHLAVIMVSRGEVERAEEIYDKIYSSQKNNPLLLYNLAVLEKRKRDYDKALEYLRAYLKNAPANARETDEAFALVEKVKEQKAQVNQEPMSDDEIETMAKVTTPKEAEERKTTAAKATEDSEKGYDSSPEDAEIQKLESDLIEE